MVELLVVIGIITILIAMVLPALNKAREHANRVVCAANLRSMGQAMTMYVQQYRYYPCHAALDVSMPGRHFAIWPTRLRAFMGGAQGAFYCPSQDERCRWDKGAPPGYTGPVALVGHTGLGYEPGEPLLMLEAKPSEPGTYFSYGYNRFGAAGMDGFRAGLGYSVVVGKLPWPGTGELHASQVRAPQEMIAIADTNANGRVAFTIWPNPVNPLGNPGRVHSSGANVLFCDGHVQWYLQRDLVLPSPGTPEYERIARMWNNTNRPYWNE